MRFLRIALLAFTLASLSSSPIHASQQSSSTSSRTISFHTHSIDTRHVMHILNKPVHHDDHKKQPFLIQLEEGEEMMRIKEEIEKYLGHDLIHYYPDNAWVTYIPPITARTIATSIPGIAWVGAYEPKYKLHGSIYDDDAVVPNYGNDLLGQFFMNETEVIKRKDEFAINVHLHAEEPCDIHQPRDLDIDSQQNLHSLIRTWMTEHGQTYDDTYEIHSRHMMTIRVKDQASIRSLSELIAKHPRVHYIERHYPNTPQNAWAKQISQTNSAPIPLSMIAAKLTGAGEVIGMIDTGIDHASCFLYDPANPQGPKVTKYVRTDKPQVTASGHRKIAQLVQFSGDAIDDHGHGTHLAGTLVGSALATGGELNKFNGLAPDAKLAVFDAGQQNEFVVPRPVDGYMFPYAAAVGAQIHLNAWGNANPAYDSTSEEFDRYQFYHPEFLAVVAAGNNGQSKVTSPATSKNSLVVGATIATKDSFTGLFCSNGIFQNPQLCKEADTITPNSIAPFSSRGPTQDQRIKPDLVTTGMYVASARNAQSAGASCTAPMDSVLKTRGGTSMAAGIVAANAALIRQYFKQGYYPSGTPTNGAITPSASLVKAILINGAMDASRVPGAAAYTTADQGFGRSVLADALPLFGAKYSLLMKKSDTPSALDPYFTRDNVNTPQTMQFCGSPSDTEDMKVTMVYPDAPANPNAGGNNLVNDLNLELSGDQGFTKQLGNGKVDDKNNVEQITVKAGTLKQRTTFTATVIAKKIQLWNNINAQQTNLGQQPYALIVTGNVVKGACAQETPTNPPVNPGQPTTSTQPTNPPVTDPNEFFAWVYGEFSMCSAPCVSTSNPNGGTQTRTVTCKSTIRGTVADSECLDISPKPDTTRRCNTNQCTGVQYEWKLGTWSPCSKPCDSGIQTRDVTCQTIATATQSSVPVDPAKCADHVKPITQQACNTLPCINGDTGMGAGGGLDDLFDWRASAPGPCSLPCGGGVAARTVLCFIGEISVADKYCMGLIKPPSTIACNTNPCTTIAPITPRPGTGTQAPPVTQAPPATPSPTGTGTGPVIPPNSTIPDPDSNPVIPPSFTGNLPVPVPQTFQWQVYDYGPCSVGCADTNAPDGGIQTRVVKCRSSLGNFDDDARCAPVPKPPVSKSCNMDACPIRDDVNLEWVTGMWGICDIDTQVQTRWLVCKDTNNRYVDFQQCQSHVGPLPATTQPCQPNAGSINEWQTKYATPVYSWYAQRFGDCSVWCNGPGKQTRGLHCLAPMGIVAASQDQCRQDPNAGTEPIKEQTCGTEACANSPQWYGGDFISCTDPDPCLGTESRHVFCIGTDGKKLTDTARCTSPQIPFTRSPCGACVPKEQTILGLKSGAVIGIAIALGLIALVGVAYLALQWRRRIRDQHNKVASRIALSKV